jgi:preprotein translocase subunit SecG
MGWLIGFLTFILVIDCLLLMLLVLIQLPKKEAGMGQAFGGAATDALFGAGSGTALTKMTKYAAGIFFGLTLFLSILNAQQTKARSGALQKGLQQAAKEALTETAPSTTATSGAATGGVQLLLKDTNAPAAATNAAKPPTNVPTPPAEPPKPN